jgi:photoactive yellow protein
MSAVLTLAFHTDHMHGALDRLGDAEFDALPFGAIGMDKEHIVRRYNATESHLAGLSPNKVLGHPLFTVVAPCMNNFMVAQRFKDAADSGASLDATIDYVLTLRMRPAKVKLRLLASADRDMSFVLVHRLI